MFKDTNLKFLFCGLLLVCFTGCSNPNSNGVGVKGGGGGNGDDKDPQDSFKEQSQKIMDRYKLESLVPAIGSKRTYQYEQKVSIRSGQGDCFYNIQETQQIIEKGNELIIGIAFQQKFEKGHVDCPNRNLFLVDHPVTFSFAEFVRKRQSDFVSWTDPEVFLFVQGRKFASAEIVSIKVEKWKEIDATKFRLKAKDLDENVFFVDSVFSNENSFLGLLEAKITNAVDGKSFYSKTTVLVD